MIPAGVFTVLKHCSIKMHECASDFFFFFIFTKGDNIYNFLCAFLKDEKGKKLLF